MHVCHLIFDPITSPLDIVLQRNNYLCTRVVRALLGRPRAVPPGSLSEARKRFLGDVQVFKLSGKTLSCYRAVSVC